MEDEKIIEMFEEFLESELGKELKAKKNGLGGRIRSYKVLIKKEQIKVRALVSLLYECGAIDIKLKGKARKKS